jgi:hypothetical protein
LSLFVAKKFEKKNGDDENEGDHENENEFDKRLLLLFLIHLSGLPFNAEFFFMLFYPLLRSTSARILLFLRNVVLCLLFGLIFNLFLLMNVFLAMGSVIGSTSIVCLLVCALICPLDIFRPRRKPIL